jgi:hypothetical protein
VGSKSASKARAALLCSRRVSVDWTATDPSSANFGIALASGFQQRRRYAIEPGSVVSGRPSGRVYQREWLSSAFPVSNLDMDGSLGARGTEPEGPSLPDGRLSKQICSWLACGLGLLAGLYGLVISGEAWVPFNPVHSWWFYDWPWSIGQCLLGLVFLIASLIALHNRRHAGLTFLTCAPIVALCLAYWDMVLRWSLNEEIVDKYNDIPRILALGFLLALPLVANRVVQGERRARYVFVIWAALAGLAFVMTKWTSSLLTELAAWSALFLILGIFWLGTYKLNWPPMLRPRPRSLPRRIAAVVIVSGLVAAVDLSAQLVLGARQSSVWTGECSGPVSFVWPRRSGRVVFTARVVRVGPATKDSRKDAADWAVGVIRERVWGLRSWDPPLVFITDGLFEEGQMYLIDGRRPEGALTRFLPIAEAGPCSQSGLLVDKGRAAKGTACGRPGTVNARKR